MSFKIHLEIRDQYLLVAASGRVTPEAILELGAEIRRHCDESGLRKVVIECKGMQGALTTLEIYDTTPRFVKAVGPEIRVAYLNPPDEWKIEDDQFSRNVASNRGGSLELFDTESDAVQWLMAGTKSALPAKQLRPSPAREENGEPDRAE